MILRGPLVLTTSFITPSVNGLSSLLSLAVSSSVVNGNPSSTVGRRHPEGRPSYRLGRHQTGTTSDPSLPYRRQRLMRLGGPGSTFNRPTKLTLGTAWKRTFHLTQSGRLIQKGVFSRGERSRGLRVSGGKRKSWKVQP